MLSRVASTLLDVFNAQAEVLCRKIPQSVTYKTDPIQPEVEALCQLAETIVLVEKERNAQSEPDSE
ncbi:hypothetical protein EDD75_0373 [Thermodesulfitimonas autotrophica]|uniref:Uncharacterized protein n=1 Tax=Thermodesulfitimonas autotrophica TaxID=1894989 RepID=A0A3N5AWF7_9THEO|nr:hypothetical protein [Thermodesulfitimonas autotrophica]RPF49556.1 hypothetical protein EDD75_0373 [Thermodesulfitimonas autotrophica]